MGPITPASELGHLCKGVIDLKVNGELKQKGDLNQMIWKTAEIINYLSQYYELAAGDLIMSGTPAGVGAIKKGMLWLGQLKAWVSLLLPLFNASRCLYFSNALFKIQKTFHSGPGVVGSNHTVAPKISSVAPS